MKRLEKASAETYALAYKRHDSDHIAELHNARPSSPFFFLKPPSSLLAPNEGPIKRPRGIELHHEVELGLVIGQRIRDLRPEDEARAVTAINCYLLAIDFTARNLQAQAKKKALPWTMAKGFDTFGPISEPFSAERFAGDPYRLGLRLSVDGETRQRDSVGLMLFRIPRILSEISRVMTLEPGDLVLTGTPKGVGPVVGGQKISIGCDNGQTGEEIGEARATWDVVDAKGLYEYQDI